MDLKTLQQHILALTHVDETASPFVSCYVGVEVGESRFRDTLDQRARTVKRGLAGRAVQDVEEALERIDNFLAGGLEPGTKGVGLFARAGEHPFFLPLQFRLPVPTRLVANSTPNIYPLIELKDTYSCYVVLLATDNGARLLGIHLGSIVEDTRTRRPMLGQHAGREWTRADYQSHRRERINQFLNEQIRALDQFISAGGYAHWLLAGNPRATSQIKRVLPRHLTLKLAGVFPASEYDRTSDVVAASLASFVDAEERESLARVDRLVGGIGSRGQAVAGTRACLEALMTAQVDVLVMAKAYQPRPGWACDGCGAGDLEAAAATVECPNCGARRVRELEIKEEMIRLAERSRSEVEIVRQSEVLMRLGGVGCLLRFLQPKQPCAKAA